MRSIPKRIGVLFCSFGIILMLMAGLIFNVSAIETTNGTLTLTCEQDGFYIASMEWKVYRVGEKQNGGLALTGDFADYPVDLSEIEDIDRMTEIASTLNNFAVLDRIEPIQSGKTDDNGVIEFNNLPNGLYLATGTKLKIEDYTYFPTPIVFIVDGNKSSVLNSFPKFYIKRTLPGSKDRFMLRKVWANADGQLDRPNVLTIGIYEDGELYEEIQLSQEDGWTYSWEGSAASEWRVKELSVPAGCYVMYRNNETQYIIMNAYDNMLLANTTTTTTATTSATDSTATTVFNDTVSTSQSTIKTDFAGSVSRTTDLTSSGTSTTSTVGTQPDESTTLSDTSTTDSNESTTVNTTKSNTNSTNKTNNAAQTTTIASKLPQTGQLWWPVPLMLLSGLVFVAIGLRLIMESKKED